MINKSEEKKAEAIKRLRALSISPETIRQFEEDGLVSISEPPHGAFVWAGDEDLARIRDFECKYNALVYLIVRSCSPFGHRDNFLFVSNYPGEWELDMEDLKDNTPLAYVYNRDVPGCSKFGCITVQKTPAGGLVRTY